MALLTLSELKDRAPSADAYARAFKREEDEDPSDTDAYAQTCLDDAESEVRMTLAAYLDKQLDDGGTVDNAVKRHLTAVAYFNGVNLGPSSGASNASPFEPAYKRATAFFKDLADRNHKQPVTAEARSGENAALTAGTAGIVTADCGFWGRGGF